MALGHSKIVDQLYKAEESGQMQTVEGHLKTLQEMIPTTIL